MKVTSGSGKGVGKLGSDVYYVSHGVQLKRDYTSNVSNPNTINQISQRIRFKLASQVAAALSPVIVIPRKKLQSPRNLFTKRNMGYFYSDGVSAQVSYEALQLTAGSSPLPPIVLERENGTLTMKFEKEPAANISRIVYCLYEVVEDNQLVYKGSTIANERDARDGFFEASVGRMNGNIVVYAYGISDKSVKATSKYNNYQVNDALQVATLFANNALKIADYGFTMTRGVLLDSGSSSNPQPDAGQFWLTALATYGQQIRYTKGSAEAVVVPAVSDFVNGGVSITLEAVAENGYNFIGWCKNGSQSPFTSEPSITFSIEANINLVARYQAIEVVSNADTIHGLE